jgi:hypothetical protein
MDSVFSSAMCFCVEQDLVVIDFVSFRVSASVLMGVEKLNRWSDAIPIFILSQQW